ncbi:Peptidase M14 carboxypeptidase A domain-containing protein [Candidatus Magnetomoraceae bacterium gMMP-1]
MRFISPKYLFLKAAVLSGVLIFAAVSFADFDPGSILEVCIENIDREGLLRLTQLGVDIDNFDGKSARVYASSELLKKIESMGYQIVMKPSPRDAVKGYHSYSELTAELKDIEAAYPKICKLHNIGKSFEGSELWFMKISDNVEKEEDEPELKYISTMHGDEPVGMELCLNLIRLLAEEYGKDDQIIKLVNEIEIWIMPLMNPDGYAYQSRYNQQGKDLNRNFPDRISDADNSPDGRAIETQHIMNWGFSHSPVLAANFHTGALVVNYPYDSDPDYRATYSATPDDNLFIRLSLAYSSLNSKMFASNIFPQGITNGMEWYLIYGGMQDWNYVWMGCNEVTIELCDIKWPDFSEISTIWADNKESMLNYMEWSLKGVRGIVIDAKTNKPLDAAISVQGIEHDTRTDPDIGDYHRILLSGTYSLTFSANGYSPETVEIIVDDTKEAARLDIQLTLKTNDPEISDAIMILRILTENALYDSAMKLDFDNSGKIGIEDAVYVLQFAAGLR